MQPRCLIVRSLTIAGLAGLAALSLTAPGATAATHHSVTPHASTATVWLCKPGTTPDPCTSSRATTSVPANGARSVSTPATATTATKYDCFYVYPTVSTESTINADLKIQSAETGAAISQVSRFSQVCRVWAPMYKQVTLRGLELGLAHVQKYENIAYDSLLSAWTDYLKNDNDGRPIEFIGHSQGAALLIRLLQSQVDTNSSLRSRVLGAIILGGNVTVPDGKVVGASFQHLPLCTKTAQDGCVIAYSSFGATPPSDAIFGRPGQGVSLQSNQTATKGVHVACVNPASIGGGTADLTPAFISSTVATPAPAVSTLWVSFPKLYAATCKQADGATWLQVSVLTTGGRPTVSATLGASWGYHVDDVNLGLGDLVRDVAAQESTYAAHH